MLDTVQVGLKVVALDVPELAHRGWSVTVRDSPGRDPTGPRKRNVSASLDVEGVRLYFRGGFCWLSAECSLPALVLGDNSQVLDWAGCETGLARVQELASDGVGVDLPDISEWNLSRVDFAWAWSVEPAPYIASLRWARLPRTRVTAWPDSVDWRTAKGRIHGRVYDKRAESGRPVDLPLRLERQTRPRREVVRVQRRRIGGKVGQVGSSDVLSVLQGAVHHLGLDTPIPSRLALRGRLVERYGLRKGRNLYGAVLEACEFGGWPSDVSADTRRRYERAVAAVGGTALSLDGELPALPIPGASAVSTT